MSVIAAPPTADNSVEDPVRRTGRASKMRAVARQAASAVLTLLLISVISYAAMNRSPKQVVINVLGKGATPEQQAAYVEAHGLDRPLLSRYLDWLGHFVSGDWGSTLTNQPVRPLVWPAFVSTTELALTTLIWSVPLAIALGVAAARRRGVLDQGMFVTMTVLAALPEFVIGITLMIVFAAQLRWLPVASVAAGQGLGYEALIAFVLPSATLGIGVIAYLWRITRASVMETLGAPFTRAAVLRGLRRRRVVWRHAVRSASVPLVNAVALNIIYLMGGVIIVENVFAFPGLGRLLIQAIAQGDSNLALSIIVLLGSAFIALSLVADVAVAWLDPRLKAGAR